MAQVRYFNGKKYISDVSFGQNGEREAREAANIIRARGGKARVIKHQHKGFHRWDVFEMETTSRIMRRHGWI